jgi:hypothetical protein
LMEEGMLTMSPTEMAVETPSLGVGRVWGGFMA